MLDPPIPVISGAVWVRDHGLRWAVGQVVAVALATTWAVWMAVGFAVAGGAVHIAPRAWSIASRASSPHRVGSVLHRAVRISIARHGFFSR